MTFESYNGIILKILILQISSYQLSVTLNSPIASDKVIYFKLTANSKVSQFYVSFKLINIFVMIQIVTLIIPLAIQVKVD